jgi:signal transduction histidine kinase
MHLKLKILFDILLSRQKPLFLCACFALFPFILFSQTKMIDSLSLLLQHARHDTTKIRLNFKLAEQLESYDVTRSNNHLEEGYKLAKIRNNKYYTAYYFHNKGELLFDMAQYNESGIHFDSAIVLYTILINSAGQDRKGLEIYKFGKTDCLTGKGLLSAKLYNYQQSIQYYLEAIAGIENMDGSGKNVYLANLYADIASDYYELEEFENALRYDKQGLFYVNLHDNIDQYVVSHLFVADDFSGLSQFDSSYVYLEKVRPIVTHLDRPKLNVRFYYILGAIYRKKKDWSNALVSFHRANEAAGQMKDDFQLLNSEEGMAACYMNLGNLPKARALAVLVLNKSNRINMPLGKVQSLQLLTAIEEKSGNIDKAYQYQNRWMQVSDSVKKEKVQGQMHEIEMKYQNAEKEKQILQLQNGNALQSLSLHKKSAFNYFLIGSVAALLITGFLVYRTLRNRQQLATQQDELQRQRIRELEKDKQLVAVDSMFKAQEEERSRMAKDLHDGLGGMLSGVKLSLGAMKGNIILSEDNTRLFAKVLDQLDHSISEMRRVAHNMMPEALVKLGLEQAIQDYCDGLNESIQLHFKVQFHGLETRLEAATEIVVYRIVQELINNVVKHADATVVLVQIMHHDNNLNITIEDNGKGFDVSNSSKGDGLNNVRSRVDYLKGQLDIQCVPGKGTSVHIDLTIQDT